MRSTAEDCYRAPPETLSHDGLDVRQIGLIIVRRQSIIPDHTIEFRLSFVDESELLNIRWPQPISDQYSLVSEFSTGE